MNKNKLISKQIKCQECGNYVTFRLPKSIKQPRKCRNCMEKKHYKQIGIRIE